MACTMTDMAIHIYRRMTRPRKCQRETKVTMLITTQVNATPSMKEVQADLFGGPQSANDSMKFTHRGRWLQAAMALQKISIHLPMS